MKRGKQRRAMLWPRLLSPGGGETSTAEPSFMLWVLVSPRPPDTDGVALLLPWYCCPCSSPRSLQRDSPSCSIYIGGIRHKIFFVTVVLPIHL